LQWFFVGDRYWDGIMVQAFFLPHFFTLSFSVSLPHSTTDGDEDEAAVDDWYFLKPPEFWLRATPIDVRTYAKSINAIVAAASGAVKVRPLSGGINCWLLGYCF
jgi:hypothetical protein